MLLYCSAAVLHHFGTAVLAAVLQCCSTVLQCCSAVVLQCCKCCSAAVMLQCYDTALQHRSTVEVQHWQCSTAVVQHLIPIFANSLLPEFYLSHMPQVELHFSVHSVI